MGDVEAVMAMHWTAVRSNLEVYFAKTRVGETGTRNLCLAIIKIREDDKLRTGTSKVSVNQKLD